MSMYDDGEGILDVMAEEHFRNAWCPKCETHAEDCIGHEDDLPISQDSGRHPAANAEDKNKTLSLFVRGQGSLHDCVHNPGSERVLIPADPGSLSLDQIESATKWFDEQRGAESNAYTASEAEARRKDWQDE